MKNWLDHQAQKVAVNGLKEFVSGLMLSNIFTSNLGKKKQCKLNMSENEKKKGNTVDRLEGKAAAQRDLRRLQERPLRGLWRVSPGKCSGLQGPGQAGVAADKVAALRGRSWGSWWAAK